MFEKTRAFCETFPGMGVPGYDLAVYKDGACILRTMGGYADLENRVPVKGDEVYNIYSCSKPITCAASFREKAFCFCRNRTPQSLTACCVT